MEKKPVSLRDLKNQLPQVRKKSEKMLQNHQQPKKLKIFNT